MRQTPFYFAFAFAALVANSASAQPPPAGRQGETCALKRLASIEIFMMPELGEVYMQATINGVPKYMALSLGLDFNMLDREVAQELGLEIKHVKIEMQDHVFVKDFRFGGFGVRNVDFIVSQRGKHWGPTTKDVAGLMSPNLRAYDIELDMAAGRMNLFEPSSCIEGPYWSNSSAASVDLQVGRMQPFYFPLVLDGKRVLSNLDTVLTHTVIRAVPARALFDIDPIAMHLPRIPDEDGDPLYSVSLQSLATEDGAISITNPHFTLIPGWSREAPVVTLGMSTLKALHIYVAFARRKLFITAASGPPHINLQLVDGHFRPPAAAAK